jgi:hypothetical protein
VTQRRSPKRTYKGTDTRLYGMQADIITVKAASPMLKATKLTAVVLKKTTFSQGVAVLRPGKSKDDLPDRFKWCEDRIDDTRKLNRLSTKRLKKIDGWEDYFSIQSSTYDYVEKFDPPIKQEGYDKIFYVLQGDYIIGAIYVNDEYIDYEVSVSSNTLHSQIQKYIKEHIDYTTQFDEDEFHVNGTRSQSPTA